MSFVFYVQIFVKYVKLRKQTSEPEDELPGEKQPVEGRKGLILQPLQTIDPVSKTDDDTNTSATKVLGSTKSDNIELPGK